MGHAGAMSREIPEPVRAAAGLAATVLDEVRKLPETVPGIPVRAVGLAMQQAMKAQQTYAGFVARGDELFTGLRGEDEPGLATFDDDEPAVAPTGFRESAFDRAGDTEPTSASGDLIIDEVAEQVEAFAEVAPDTEAILDEIAIDELVDQAPTLEETAPAKPAKAAKAPKAAKPVKATKPRKTAKPAEETGEAAEQTALLEATLAAPGPAGSTTAEATLDDEPTADVATPVDVLTPAGEVEAVEATVTDEGVAATEAPAEDAPTAAAETPTTESPATEKPATEKPATETSTSETSTSETSTAPADELAISADADSKAPTNAPVDGYDSFTVAQLRGRLRGYALTTVQDLVAYEQATQARAPYLTLLRNRLEKLEEQAIESSPLAPRGA